MENARFDEVAFKFAMFKAFLDETMKFKANFFFQRFMSQTRQTDEISEQFGRKRAKNLKIRSKTYRSHQASNYVSIWSKTRFFERPALTRAHPRSEVAPARAHPRSAKGAFLTKSTI